jgi:multicomponent Na+:H+ antiporter subunit C
MTQDLIYSLTSIALFGIGFYGLIATTHILRKLIAINIMGVGVFMLLLATAYHAGNIVDPVPHAMVLTGIVVAVAGTALCLWLAVNISAFDQNTPIETRQRSIPRVNTND